VARGSGSASGSWVCDAHDEPSGCCSAAQGDAAAFGTERFSCEGYSCNYDLCGVCVGARSGRIRTGPTGGVNLSDVLVDSKGSGFLVDARTVATVLSALAVKEEPEAVEHVEHAEDLESTSSLSDGCPTMKHLERRAKRRRVLVGDAQEACKALTVLWSLGLGPMDQEREAVANIAREALE